MDVEIVIRPVEVNSSVVAYADVILDGWLCLTDFSIQKNHFNGSLFVVVPQTCQGDVYKNIVNPLNRDKFNDFLGLILESYKKTI